MSNTTTELITSIQIRGSIPTSDSLFSNSNFLQILNEEMLNTVVPVLVKINEDYSLVTYDVSLVANQSSYRLPTRVSTIRDIQLVNGTQVYSLPRLFEDDRTSTTQGPMGYFVKGNKIEVSPTPTSATSTLRIIYFRRPSTLVLPTACAQITAINGTQVTVSACPSTMTTNTVVDIVQSKSPYDILTQDTVLTGVSGTTLTFASLDSDLIVGDYICLAGQSCTPGVQEELVPLLVQAALCVVMSSKKDSSATLELNKLENMKKTLVDLLSPRTRSDDKKIVSNNSLLNFLR